MTDPTDPVVTDADITAALRLLRALTGGEPYAPHVHPTAREIARYRVEIAAALDRAWLAHCESYPGETAHHAHELLRRVVSGEG